ncbi:hypothetical protein T552_02026 [Pneumocystis carinii B80]|uniref:Uncharacterized protein n=1 Tax=Pneumocystis carinii (strain B80) TaxID=1408658 RepID=A0A0W4ZIH0_PNEC8|nr:hypothetical protein T552_02026 [Pneumocystis carinii B80]KTW28167.1 hypothetical protein T552_02026 [Pneumocystis carinii B80]
MCFNFFTSHEKPMNNKTKSCMCLPLSCLSDKSCKEECEIMKLPNEQSGLDLYDCFFGDEMPVYVGKSHGSSKKSNKDIQVNSNALKDIFEINPQYDDGNVEEIIKGLSKNTSSLKNLKLNKLFDNPLDRESKCTELITMSMNSQQMLGKYGFNLLNRELGTIPENEVLHCFYTTYNRKHVHI